MLEQNIQLISEHKMFYQHARLLYLWNNKVNGNWHRVKTVFWRVDIFAVYTRLLDIRDVVVDNE